MNKEALDRIAMKLSLSQAEETKLTLAECRMLHEIATFIFDNRETLRWAIRAASDYAMSMPPDEGVEARVECAEVLTNLERLLGLIQASAPQGSDLGQLPRASEVNDETQRRMRVRLDSWVTGLRQLPPPPGESVFLGKIVFTVLREKPEDGILISALDAIETRDGGSMNRERLLRVQVQTTGPEEEF